MPRRYNSKETIELILSASAKLFSEKGFDNTSMQEIVDESGVSKGSIFHHFNSKEEILITVMVSKAEAESRQIRIWLGEIENMTAKEKMIALLDRILEDTVNIGAEALGRQILKSPQMILVAMKESLKIAAPIYAELFKEGIEDGSITTSLPDQCAEAFTLLMSFWCDDAIFECDEKGLLDRAVFFQQMMRGVGADIITDKHVYQIVKTCSATN